MIIRKLHPERDLERFSRLRQEALEMQPPVFLESPEAFSALTPQARSERLADGGYGNFVLGVSLEGQQDLVGMAGLYHEQGARNAHRANVWGVFIRPAYRGQGLGQALMQSLIAAAEQQKSAEFLALRITAGNQAALSLYERMGFTRYGTEPGAMKVDGQYYDEHLLQLALRWPSI